MAERQLTQILTQLKSAPSYETALPLLSKAKLLLAQLNALTPSPSVPPQIQSLALQTYEQGALASIRASNPQAFTRYVDQLAPFYEQHPSDEKNKITGLYLLLLITQGGYDEFHSELERLTAVSASAFDAVESDRYLGYPIRIERWLMEGSYDRVWKAMKQGEVPCEEFSVFSEILTVQIRNEIARSSERAYPSLPISSTKALLFLPSEGEVMEYAKSRGWILRDGHIYFPPAVAAQETGEDGEKKEMSQVVIENALEYARQLETIV
ncbi:26S proteasome regulatory subunit N12 [Echria macrotheca]|uniref:26S proteasome regulatory subunit N12 n=1 Tax=Echria macrotheca TaxID=438768 RepID=A0AAJ0BCW9_9PEZI|nr:26S proteasome regulatory subunit N12 [Echria macrotheca]